MKALLLAALALAASAVPARAQIWGSARSNQFHVSSATNAGAATAGFDKLVLNWSKSLGFSNPGPYGDSVSIDDNGVLYVSGGDRVYSLTASSGGIVWQSSQAVGGAWTQPVVQGAQVVSSSANAIVSFSSANGTYNWVVYPVGLTASGLIGGTASIQQFSAQGHGMTDGMFWFSASGENISGSGLRDGLLRINTGGLVMSALTDSAGTNSMHPAVSGGGNIYFKLGDGTLNKCPNGPVCVQSATGASGASQGGVTFDPVHNSILTYANASGIKVRSYDATNLATINWTSTQTFTTVLYPPSVSTYGVYLVADGRLYGFDSTNGNVTLNIDLGGVDDSYSLGPPTVAGSTAIYVVGQRNFRTRFYNVNPQTGAMRWSLDVNDDLMSNKPQVSVSTNAIYLHTYGAGEGHVVRSYSQGTYASLLVSSTPATTSGLVRTTTVTVQALTAGLTPVVGVPVQYSLTSPSGSNVVVTPLQYSSLQNFSYTTSVGTVSYRIDEYAAGWTPTLTTSFTSTFSVTAPGLGASNLAIADAPISTFTLTLSTPTVEINGTNYVRASTVTVKVTNGVGAGIPNVPVRINTVNYLNNNCGGDLTPDTLVTPGSQFGGVTLTDALGNAAFVYHTRYAVGSTMCGAGLALPNVAPLINAYAMGGAPRLSASLADARPSTYTVVYSTPAIQSDVKTATMTVTVYDAVGSTVPGTFVLLQSLTMSTHFIYGSGNLLSGPTTTCGGTGIYGVTNSLGAVSFYMDGTGCGANTFDNYADTFSTASVFTPGVAVSTPAIGIESNFLSAYTVSVPTITSVGVAFQSTVTAVNAYGHKIPKYTESGVTLTPLFDQTAVQGTGTLGTSVVSFAGSGGQVVISSQTYNKIENIQVKATRGSGSIKTGLSGTLIIQGPDHFIVTMPTSAAAGVPFSMTVRAVDASSTPVVGYAGTLSLSAFNAASPANSGAGILGVTNVNMPANGVITFNQTYTKAENIVVRASDSGASLVGQSSYTTTVGAGAPGAITLLANPQSSIAGVPSVLTATVLDGYSNPVAGATANFSVAVGSGIVSLSLSNGSVVSAVTSTQAVTDASGQAVAFFSSTNSLSAQADLLRASIGALARDTTIYTTVLVTSAGGAVVNFANPALRADVPANTYGFSVRLGIQGKTELAASDLAITTAAFAATANTFVSTTVLKLSAVRDASPTVAAGRGSKLLTVSMPYTVTSGSISVGAYGAQSVLVPLSVMRVFKLNQASSVFEQVLDGATTVDSLNGKITAEVADPDGIYVLGAPAFTTLAAASSATVTTALAGGTSAQVIVPLGGFATPATISVTVPGASSVPPLPSRPGLTGLGITVSVSAGGLQPAAPVTIKIGYRPIDVAGINPDYLRLARYDATTGWVVLDSSADSAARQVIGTTNHFSLFQIVAQAPGASVADAFVFPNPFRPALGHTNLKISNLPAAAHVKIYTAAGRLLKELDADAAGQILTWNGTDRDGRGLASGVYLAVVEGNGSRRTIKFAVQR